MNREETKKIIEIITRAYPRMKIVETKEDVDLWHICLDDLDYPKARQAAINLVKRIQGFPPDIAMIREEYGKINGEEQRELGEIRRCYEQARSYYPSCGEVGYGWSEFKERAKTVAEAERLKNMIISYVNNAEGDVMDFAKCIHTIRRDSKNVLVVGGEGGMKGDSLR